MCWWLPPPWGCSTGFMATPRTCTQQRQQQQKQQQQKQEHARQRGARDGAQPGEEVSAMHTATHVLQQAGLVTASAIALAVTHTHTGMEQVVPHAPTHMYCKLL